MAVPAIVHNSNQDLVATNLMGRALYAPHSADKFSLLASWAATLETEPELRADTTHVHQQGAS